MTTMFSSYSRAIMLRPISPSPPSGMARKRGRLAKKGKLFLRLQDRRSSCNQHAPPLVHPIEVGLDGVEVLSQRPHQKTVIQRGRRMIDRNVRHAVLDDDFAVKTRERLVPRQQPRQGVPTEQQADFRLYQPQLLPEIGRTGPAIRGYDVADARR